MGELSFQPSRFGDADALRTLQITRLKETLRRAYERVPYYRNLFDSAGITPADIAGLDDLSSLPFTTKDALRETYPFGMFAVPLGEIARIHASSGTTGKPTVVGYTQGDMEVWAELMARSFQVTGARPGEIVHNAIPYGLFTGGLGWHGGAERFGVAVIPASGGATERHVQLIADLRPDILLGTPSYLLVIADALAAHGIGPVECSLRLAMFGAEPCSEAMRAEIEERLGVEAYDSYGLSELIGPGVAQEVPGDKGFLTLWEDCFLPEIIDPETGEVPPEGEPGELVLTTLAKEAMPIVRYRTRDRTRLLPGKGMPFRRIERIAGRTDDMIIIRGVNVFPSQIEEVIAGDPELAPHYLVEVSRPARLDQLTIRVECRGAPEAERGALARKTETRIRNVLGVSATVSVEAPGTIERSTGKAKRIVDLRPRQ
ncbi:MAG: phenylacetate--CoA ligase family protein [Propylenella sp.]